MVILKGAPGKAKWEIVLGILAWVPIYTSSHGACVALSYCKMLRQQLRVAVFSSQLPVTFQKSCTSMWMWLFYCVFPSIDFYYFKRIAYWFSNEHSVTFYFYLSVIMWLPYSPCICQSPRFLSFKHFRLCPSSTYPLGNLSIFLINFKSFWLAISFMFFCEYFSSGLLFPT